MELEAQCNKSNVLRTRCKMSIYLGACLKLPLFLIENLNAHRKQWFKLANSIDNYHTATLILSNIKLINLNQKTIKGPLNFTWK